jgi:hypothetical protein
MRVFAFVIAATIFEASGDAVIRLSLHCHSLASRLILFLAGSMLLVLYQGQTRKRRHAGPKYQKEANSRQTARRRPICQLDGTRVHPPTINWNF